ncbi:MAG: GAF domain-containing protein [Candidatus Kapabacteria bacterium]|nr:GAF domain-containing protein [Candidatus Kapabacteria bacterium]
MTLNDELKELLRDEDDFITNAANFSALVFDKVPDLNWVGFYMLKNNELLLGPFQGKPACIRIQLGKGVCGTSAKNRKTIIVEDVHDFPGHIACDSASNSEIVLPMIILGKLYGVLDIDSPLKSRFKEDDKILFEDMLNTLLDNTNMDKIYDYYNT